MFLKYPQKGRWVILFPVEIDYFLNNYIFKKLFSALLNELSIHYNIIFHTSSKVNTVEDMKNDMDFYQPNPGFKNQMHCLLYVINAKTYPSDKKAGKFKTIEEIRNKHKKDGTVFLAFLIWNEKKWCMQIISVQ